MIVRQKIVLDKARMAKMFVSAKDRTYRFNTYVKRSYDQYKDNTREGSAEDLGFKIHLRRPLCNRFGNSNRDVPKALCGRGFKRWRYQVF